MGAIMNLLLFLLLGMLLTIAWFVILDLWNHGWDDHVLGKSYRKKWATEIESGRMPASLRMKGAILFNAGLANAKLIGTKLTSAMMMGVNLDGADLSGADLTNTGLKKDIILSKYKNVIFNEDTKWDVSDQLN